jgi:hypothetical protein
MNCSAFSEPSRQFTRALKRRNLTGGSLNGSLQGPVMRCTGERVNRPPHQILLSNRSFLVGLYLCEFLLSISTLWKSREAIPKLIATICARNEVSKDREQPASCCERMARPGETRTPDPLLRSYAVQNSKCRFWCRLRGSASFISPLNLDRTWTENFGVNPQDGTVFCEHGLRCVANCSRLPGS